MSAFDVSLWVDLLNHFGIPSLMAVSLVLWIRLGRRWVYAYWIIMALSLAALALDVAHEGWRAFLFQDPDFHMQGSVIVSEDGKKVARVSVGRMFTNPPANSSPLDLPAKVADWAVVLLSLSAPFWVKRLRCKLGLKDT